MRRKRLKRGLTVLGFGALLMVSGGTWGVDGAAPQAPVQVYRGQVQEIEIDRCGRQAGTCEGSLVLAQARGQKLALAIPAGTLIQRGEQRLYLAELGIGNYVTVQTMPLSAPARQGHGRVWTWDEIDHDRVKRAGASE